MSSYRQKTFQLFLLMTFALFGCAKSVEDKTATAASVPVQYMAQVDSTLDGCGAVLCIRDASNNLCAFPKGIPSEELTADAVFWVEGNLGVKPPDPPGIVTTCMGMVRNIIVIQNYRKL